MDEDWCGGWRRIARAWQSASAEDRQRFVYYTAGRTLMPLAVIGYFGFWGFLFCFGFALWNVGKS